MAISLSRVGLKLKYIPFGTISLGDTFSVSEIAAVYLKIDTVYRTPESITLDDEVNAVKITTGELAFFKKTELVNKVAGEFSYTQEKDL